MSLIPLLVVGVALLDPARLIAEFVISRHGLHLGRPRGPTPVPRAVGSGHDGGWIQAVGLLIRIVTRADLTWRVDREERARDRWGAESAQKPASATTALRPEYAQRRLSEIGEGAKR